MSQNIAELKQEFAAKLAAADSMQTLEEIRVDFLGKTGKRDRASQIHEGYEPRREKDLRSGGKRP